jgi:hypothetical protein
MQHPASHVATRLDTAEALGLLPRGYSGGSWTDEIETIGRACCSRIFGLPW